MKMKFIENQYLISHLRFYNFLYTFVDGKICPNNLSFAIAFMVLAKMKSNQNFVEIEHIPMANINSKPTSEEWTLKCVYVCAIACGWFLYTYARVLGRTYINIMICQKLFQINYVFWNHQSFAMCVRAIFPFWSYYLNNLQLIIRYSI